MIEKLCRLVCGAALVLLLAGLLYHHWQIIIAAVPLDLYEGTMPLITGIIAEGHNPYTRPFQPQAADVYPPLYNMLVAPLTVLFGNTFALHRVVSAGFILLACALCGLAAWKHGGSRLYGAAAAVLMYAALLFYGTPVSSTNAPGVALFLLVLLVPWHYGFSNRSLVFALVCALLSFYTKQYFILGIAILCLYLFLCVSMLRAVLLGAAFAVAIVGSLSVVHSTSPYYLDNTFFAPAAAINGLQSWQILSMQLRFYVATYTGLLAAILICAGLAAWRVGWPGLSQRMVAGLRLARAGWRGPLLAGTGGFFWFCLCWAFVAIVFWLGRNPGNYMTYLFQLMSPFLLIAGLGLVARQPIKFWVVAPLLLLNFHQVYDILHKDFSYDKNEWLKVEALIAESDEILATQMLVMSLLQHDKHVFQDGHTFYFPLAASKPRWLVKAREQDRVAFIWRQFMTDLYRKIERREFDLIVVSPWEMRGIFKRNPPPFEDVTGKAFLSRHYYVQERVRLSMTDRHGGGTYDILVWRPRPDGASLQ